MSITRVVQVQFKADLDAATIKKTLDSVKALKQNCVNPKTQKPYIRSIQVGQDVSPEPLNGDFKHQFVITFDNAADRDYYVEGDPAHGAVKEVIESRIDKVQILDIINGQY